MLGEFIHPQLVDKLSLALVARFNLKAEPKDVASFINKFGKKEDDTSDFSLSGFPIGKIQSHDQLKSVYKQAIEKNQFFNIISGRWVNDGNNSLYYGTGWCAKRNSPEHQAMIKILSADVPDEKEIEIVEKGEWMVVKDTKYIWCSKRNKVVGRLKNGDPTTLTHETIKLVKEHGLEWEKIDEEELDQCRLEPFDDSSSKSTPSKKEL